MASPFERAFSPAFQQASAAALKSMDDKRQEALLEKRMLEQRAYTKEQQLDQRVYNEKEQEKLREINAVLLEDERDFNRMEKSKNEALNLGATQEILDTYMHGQNEYALGLLMDELREQNKAGVAASQAGKPFVPVRIPGNPEFDYPGTSTSGVTFTEPSAGFKRGYADEEAKAAEQKFLAKAARDEALATAQGVNAQSLGFAATERDRVENEARWLAASNAPAGFPFDFNSLNWKDQIKDAENIQDLQKKQLTAGLPSSPSSVDLVRFDPEDGDPIKESVFYKPTVEDYAKLSEAQRAMISKQEALSAGEKAAAVAKIEQGNKDAQTAADYNAMQSGKPPPQPVTISEKNPFRLVSSPPPLSAQPAPSFAKMRIELDKDKQAREQAQLVDMQTKLARSKSALASEEGYRSVYGAVGSPEQIAEFERTHRPVTTTTRNEAGDETSRQLIWRRKEDAENGDPDEGVIRNPDGSPKATFRIIPRKSPSK